MKKFLQDSDVLSRRALLGGIVSPWRVRFARGVRPAGK